MEAILAERILQHKKNHLYRQRTVRDAKQLSFCSSDYLGMAQHPTIISAFQNAATHYGVSSSSSFIVNGYTDAHQQLEFAFAKFLQREAALLFSCGYMANLGVLSVLTNHSDTVFADKFIHASLIDAIQLSRAKLIRFPHRNYAHLECLLAKKQEKRPWIVTDSVFSMQGDLADLPFLVTLCERYGAPLMVDDAHGIGVLGQRGAGICEHYQLSSRDVPILVCPLAKAFGVMGAIVAGSSEFIEALIQFARSYHYTNALPPALAVAALMSLECVEHETWRRKKLQSLIHYFREFAKELDLPLSDSLTPIQPIIIGSSMKACAISEKLLLQDIRLNAMRPPTVPEKLACLRVSLTCLHEENQIKNLLIHIKRIYDDLS